MWWTPFSATTTPMTWWTESMTATHRRCQEQFLTILKILILKDAHHYGADSTFNEDHGTCHSSYLGPDGSAVAVTASVNLLWGCKFMSTSTGIIMNNQVVLDVFITSASEAFLTPSSI